MLAIADPASGALSLVFKDVADLDNCIENLNKLKMYKEDFSATWPAVYTIHTTKKPTEKQVSDHADGCKRVHLS